VRALTAVMADYVNRGKRILVYSREGTGRAAAVLSSYLITRYKFNPTDLMNMYRSSNFRPNLNVGFVRQLARLSAGNKIPSHIK
jgi:protein-tyrosine phosphatase